MVYSFTKGMIMSCCPTPRGYPVKHLAVIHSVMLNVVKHLVFNGAGSWKDTDSERSEE
jgi:trehalose utilization protein